MGAHSSCVDSKRIAPPSVKKRVVSPTGFRSNQKPQATILGAATPTTAVRPQVFLQFLYNPIGDATALGRCLTLPLTIGVIMLLTAALLQVFMTGCT
jgi:tartrate dehydratase beta subunit/fumarate hydratase class I family protein